MSMIMIRPLNNIMLFINYYIIIIIMLLFFSPIIRSLIQMIVIQNLLFDTYKLRKSTKLKTAIQEY